MSIRVTCPGCYTRFNVSDRFAGREGPCPKCKAVIHIPATSEEVKVHAPDEFGPTGTTGTGVLKPVFRQETKLSPVQMVLIAATIVGFLVISLLLRWGVADKATFSSWVLMALAVVLAAPCVYAAYTFLRDQELGALSGQDLWVRVAACSIIYGLLWVAFYLANMAMVDDYGTTTHVLGTIAMFAAGGVTANLFLGLDMLMGILHYGMYFCCCLLCRVVAGFAALPSLPESVIEPAALALVNQGIVPLLI